MTIEIKPYSSAEESAWDEFCMNSPNSTILHTRRFIGYHGSRFIDKSALILESGILIGVFPAAESPLNSKIVISHPGITYGGIVHDGRLKGMRMVTALTSLSQFYASLGYQLLQYKALPYIYSQLPSQDDLYALFLLGAQRSRCDLSSTIDLHNRRPLGQRRRRSLKRSQKMVMLSDDIVLLGQLWNVIAQNLSNAHGAKPVHSFDELSLLHKLFPRHICIRCALIDGRVEAGVVFFNSRTVWHAQYIAASLKARENSALDAVFDAAIADALRFGARYFDFGTSNEENGKVLNEGLYTYKSEFGGGGVVHELYEVSLEK